MYWKSNNYIIFNIYTHKLLNKLYSSIYVPNNIIKILLLNHETYLENYHTFLVIVFTEKLFSPFW